MSSLIAYRPCRDYPPTCAPIYGRCCLDEDEAYSAQEREFYRDQEAAFEADKFDATSAGVA